jgi:hypothetical protein
LTVATPDAIAAEARRIAALRLDPDAVVAEITLASARLGIPYKALGSPTILAAIKLHRSDLRALGAIARARKYAKRRNQERAIAALEAAAPSLVDAGFLGEHPGAIREAAAIFRSLPIAIEVQRECRAVARFIAGLTTC